MPKRDNHGLGEKLRAAGFHTPDYTAIQNIGRMGLSARNFSGIFRYLEPRAPTIVKHPPFVSLLTDTHFKKARRTDSQHILDEIAQLPDYDSETATANLICGGLLLQAKETFAGRVRSLHLGLVVSETTPPELLQQEQNLLLDHLNILISQRKKTPTYSLPLATVEGYAHSKSMLVAGVAKMLPMSLTLGPLQVEPPQVEPTAGQ